MKEIITEINYEKKVVVETTKILGIVVFKHTVPYYVGVHGDIRIIR